MSIKAYFYVWALLLIALGAGLFFLPSDKTVYHIYIVMAYILCVLVYLIVFYHKIVKPMHTIGNGMELLREQDFSSRLSPVGQYEADRIVNIFNRMMDQLKQERLRLREQNMFLDLLIKASPMGVVILDLSDNVSQLNPMAVRMMDLPEDKVVGRHLEDVRCPLAHELSLIKPDQTAVVRLNDANIYKCTRSSFVDCGFPHPFFLIERMTDELMRAERKAYEKVIRMIAHEVNNTTAGITSTLDTVHQTLAEEAGMEEAAVRLTQAIADVYEANGIKEKVKSEPENRLTCSAVIWSNRRREIWMFGDCRCRVKGRTFTNPKKVDDVLAGIRSDVLRYLTAHGHSVEELQTRDIGREMIFDALRDQCAFQNAESVNPYRYTVLDGFRVDPQTVPVVRAGEATEIVLATDGYPVLYDTLAETEACLRETLKNDPLCFNSNPATKGVMKGNESFDDRTYLRLAI